MWKGSNIFFVGEGTALDVGFYLCHYFVLLKKHEKMLSFVEKK